SLDSASGYTMQLDMFPGNSNYRFTFSPCQPSVSLYECQSSYCCMYAPLEDDSFARSCGSTIPENGDESVPGQVTAVYVGDNCENDGPLTPYPVELSVTYVCDKKAGRGSPTLVSAPHSDYMCMKDGLNVYGVQWTTDAVCSKAGTAWGTYFLVTLGLVVGIYLIGGISYKRLVEGAYGRECIPHEPMWYVT
ncbi:mannose-6-phosphate receptor, partial [Kipferlia bialata]